jgi:lycopene beta-cyclase
MLRALDRGLVGGPELFAALFRSNPPQRVLRFLDGSSSRREEVALMATAPTWPMLRASVGDAAARVRRRRSTRA